MQQRNGLTIRLILSFVLILTCAQRYAAANTLAVVYPDVREPYLSLFDQIRKGVQDQYDDKVIGIAVPMTSSSDSLLTDFTNSNVTKAVFLGKKGYDLAKPMVGKIDLVVGAFPLRPGGMGGVSVDASPDTTFGYLRKLAPKVSTVHVIYSRYNTWVIKLAEIAAQKHNLKLNAIPANNLKKAVMHYHKLMPELQPNTDAIWLPLDRKTVNDKIVLPMILERAWERRAVVMSSKPTHAKRGALFSLYPDNYRVGVRLAEMVQDGLTTDVEPMRQILIAVNLRTAAHLGYKYEGQITEEFHLMFPER